MTVAGAPLSGVGEAVEDVVSGGRDCVAGVDVASSFGVGDGRSGADVFAISVGETVAVDPAVGGTAESTVGRAGTCRVLVGSTLVPVSGDDTPRREVSGEQANRMEAQQASSRAAAVFFMVDDGFTQMSGVNRLITTNGQGRTLMRNSLAPHSTQMERTAERPFLVVTASSHGMQSWPSMPLCHSGNAGSNCGSSTQAGGSGMGPEDRGSELPAAGSRGGISPVR